MRGLEFRAWGLGLKAFFGLEMCSSSFGASVLIVGAARIPLLSGLWFIVFPGCRVGVSHRLTTIANTRAPSCGALGLWWNRHGLGIRVFGFNYWLLQ